MGNFCLLRFAIEIGLITTPTRPLILPQVCTSVMQHGLRIVEDLKDGLQRHLRSAGYSNLQEMVGCALPNLTEPTGLNVATEVNLGDI